VVDRPSADDASARAWSADDAVTALYLSQYRPLVRLATLLTRDLGLAEEIVQDCFVALHQRWRRLRDPEAGTAYLRRCVVNGSRSALRRRGVAERFALRTGEREPAPSAESLALAAGTHADVLAAVRTLPARQREALVLRYYLDLSEMQTAEVMGVSTGAVKSHTARALAALRRVLEEPGR
jgi:RNA polymerase sigma-70 factor (sigma-E family)